MRSTGDSPNGTPRFVATNGRWKRRRRRRAGAAALAHIALGGIYLDRGRVADALREFTAASLLDPTRADAYTLHGIANSPPFPTTPPQPSWHFKRRGARPRGRPQRVPARTATGQGRQIRGRRQSVAAGCRKLPPPADERVVATGAPFMRFGIVEEKSGVEPFFPPAIYADGFTLLARGEYAAALASFRSASSRDPLVADEANRTGCEGPPTRFGRLDRHGDRAAPGGYRARARARRAASRARAGLGRGGTIRPGVDELRTAVRLSPGDERAHLALADALCARDAPMPPRKRCARRSRGSPRRDARTTRWRGCISARANRSRRSSRSRRASRSTRSSA